MNLVSNAFKTLKNMNQLLQIKLNGQTSSTRCCTIAELLRENDAPEVGVAVALNGAVVRRAELETTLLKLNDEIEIIRAVQGG